MSAKTVAKLMRQAGIIGISPRGFVPATTQAEGNQRLHERWQGFTARKKKPVIANVAVARELAGWPWSLAVME